MKKNEEDVRVYLEVERTVEAMSWSFDDSYVP